MQGHRVSAISTASDSSACSSVDSSENGGIGGVGGSGGAGVLLRGPAERLAGMVKPTLTNPFSTTKLPYYVTYLSLSRELRK